MRSGNTIRSRLLQALTLLALATILSACAGRPKPLDPTQPFNVTEVRVTAESIEDFGFAGRLQQSLEATAGRGTSDIGQTSVLQIVVLDRRAEPGLIGFFDRSIRTASLDLELIDAGTGQVMRSGAVRGSSAIGDGQGAETALIARLVDDTRALLGLSGYAPHPVSGAKRQVAYPLARPDALTDAARLAADPLLNGTVTPTSLDLDPEPQAAPVLDISRPLLDAAPKPEAPKAETPVASPALVTVPRGPRLPAQAPEIASAPAGIAGDEPCIITLDNDCNDPDSQ